MNMDLKKIIREETGLSNTPPPKGVKPIHVIYFSSNDTVLNKQDFEWEGEFTLDTIDFNDPMSVSKNGFGGDPESLLEEVREFIQDEILEWVQGDSPADVGAREFHERLLETMAIRSFVIRVEEVGRTDSSFFEDL